MQEIEQANHLSNIANAQAGFGIQGSNQAHDNARAAHQRIANNPTFSNGVRRAHQTKADQHSKILSDRANGLVRSPYC